MLAVLLNRGPDHPDAGRVQTITMSISRLSVVMSFAGHAAALGVIFWFVGTTVPQTPLNPINVILIEEFSPATPANEAEAHSAAPIATPLAELRHSPQIEPVSPEPEPASPAPAELDPAGPTPGTDLPISEAQQAEPSFPKPAAQPAASQTLRQRVGDRQTKSLPPQKRRAEPGATAVAAAPDPLPPSRAIAAVAPQVVAAPFAVPQRPAMPTPPLTEVSAAYRSALSAWLERHKKYPIAARQRGEEGSAVLQFRVDREGRIIRYVLPRSTGYAELDRAVHELMQGPRLPPFPASMTQPEIELAVTIRFNLSR